MPKKATKSEKPKNNLGVWLGVEMKAKLAELAEQDHRSLSQYAAIILEKHIAQVSKGA